MRPDSKKKKQTDTARDHTHNKRESGDKTKTQAKPTEKMTMRIITTTHVERNAAISVL